MPYSENLSICCKQIINNIMKLNCIKEVLDERGITQTWLANKLGKSFNSVNAYVCNRTQPNLETLLQISQILNVEMKDLISESKELNER